MARKTGLKGLQEWAKHVTQGYSNVDITNMTTSFRNGLAFCAIIHRYRPDLIPYNTLRKEDVLKNNQLAFTVAENELDIPALLDAEDMVALSVPDKLSVATYLVQYYNYFKDKAPSSQLPGAKVTTPTSKPLGEPPPAAKRTKVETIGPASLQAKATSPSPKKPDAGKQTPVNMNKPIGNVTTPTHITPTKPHPSPTTTVKAVVNETKGSSKETTPEPAEQVSKIGKGRRSKFRPPAPIDQLKVTANAPARNSVKRGSMGSENCDACGERVFLMERLAVEGHIFHRPCFKCFTCKCLLKPGSYEFDSKGGVFYCQAHYREALRQSTLKRTMQQRGLLNGDEETEKEKPTDAKRMKDETQQPTSPVKSTQSSSPMSPTPEITREESSKIKAGLPGLLKSLAENKHEANGDGESNRTSPAHTTEKVKVETKTAPSKPEPPKVQSTTNSAKPESPISASQSPKTEPSFTAAAGKVVPPRRPTWSPKIPPRELPKMATASELSKVATSTEPPRRPTWSPKIQSRELPKTESPKAAGTTSEASRRPTWSPKRHPQELPKTESPKVAGTTSEAPRRPTWSPKIQPHELPKRPPESPKVSTGVGKVGGEAPRRPTWSPKVQPVEGTRGGKGELPKTTLAWLAKGKEVETVGGQRPPKPLRHATVSSIPAKPRPPVTAVPAKPSPPPVAVGRRPDQTRVMADSIPEEPTTTTTKVSPARTTEQGSSGPIKPPRRKKPHPPGPGVAEGKAKGLSSQQPIVVRQLPAAAGGGGDGKKEGVLSKRPAPPRPYRPPSVRKPLSQSDVHTVNEQRHRRRLGQLRRELRTLESEQLKLEAKGIELERQLRSKDIDVDEHLMEEWFSLVNQKNLLVRHESDLVYELRDLELIEQHDQLEKEIRQRVAKDDSLKSELEKLEEEAMINELVELVEKRDQLLWALHFEKGRDEEEDRQVELVASVTGYSLHRQTS